MLPNEKVVDSFSQILKDLTEKFKKSNVRTQLGQVLDLMRNIVKAMDKSQVLDDCSNLLDTYKVKVDKLASLKKRVKQGDKACIEVLKQRKDIDETVDALNQERMLIELTLEELAKLNQTDFNIQLIPQETLQQTDLEQLRGRLQVSMIELVREKC